MEVNEANSVKDSFSYYSLDASLAELPIGYSRTEIGMIPDDWECRPLGELTTRVGSGLTPTGGARVYVQEGRPFLRSQNIGWGVLSLEDLAYITDEIHASFRASEIRDGDVLLNITGASIGRSAVADARIAKGNVNQHVCGIRTDPGLLDPTFLNAYLLSESGQKQIDSFQAGGNRQGLNYNQIRSFLIPLPPITEQHAIAEALSDVDELLGALEALIAKKRDIKQAAMQQLLTGKTRLPGFGGARLAVTNTEIGELPADWRVIPVKEMTRGHKQGYYTKDQYVNDGVRLVRITDLLNQRIDYDSMPMLRLRSSDRDLYRIRVGDFLFARSGAIGRYGIVDENVDAIFGSYIIRFTFDSAVLRNEFFGYLYETNLVWKQLLSITQGSSNININAANIKCIQIPLPTITEQNAIVSVLSDMDAEIAALEARRDKTRAIKQGMMQQLLTGRIRLVKPQPVEAEA